MDKVGRGEQMQTALHRGGGEDRKDLRRRGDQLK